MIFSKKGWEVVDIHTMEEKGEGSVIRYSTIFVVTKIKIMLAGLKSVDS
ncbi:MAG: hypothetical protein ACFFC7_26215 [Candidatus Hermodarchaeota archaeon]